MSSPPKMTKLDLKLCACPLTPWRAVRMGRSALLSRIALVFVEQPGDHGGAQQAGGPFRSSLSGDLGARRDSATRVGPGKVGPNFYGLQSQPPNLARRLIRKKYTLRAPAPFHLGGGRSVDAGRPVDALWTLCGRSWTLLDAPWTFPLVTGTLLVFRERIPVMGWRRGAAWRARACA